MPITTASAPPPTEKRDEGSSVTTLQTRTTLRLDRRRSPRLERSGSAMAAFFDEDGALSLTRVEVVDVSDSGLGLICPVEVPPGVRFSLYSGSSLPHTTGTVARCAPEGEDFRIGLCCDRRLAA